MLVPQRAASLLLEDVMEYHLAGGNKGNGPHPQFKLIDWIRAGELTGNDLVWRQGLEGWKRLDEVLEFEPYWPSAKDEEPAGELTAESEPELSGLAEPKPWRRFWARMLDYMWFIAVVAFALPLLVPLDAKEWVELARGKYEPLIGSLVVLAYVPLEAWMLARWGGTPGRTLMRLKVRTLEGHTPTFQQALARSLQVYVRGVGLWLPLLSLLVMSWARMRLLRKGVTSWDEACMTRVEAEVLERWRYVLLGGLLMVILALAVLGWMARPELMTATESAQS